MLVERVSRFLCDPRAESFEELALAVFAFQYERVALYRTLCDGRGVSPATVRDGREGPPGRGAAEGLQEQRHWDDGRCRTSRPRRRRRRDRAGQRRKRRAQRPLPAPPPPLSPR